MAHKTVHETVAVKTVFTPCSQM